MKQVGEFEIYELFHYRNKQLVLAGKLKSGGPVSHQNDVLQKDLFVSFSFNGMRIESKINRLDGGFTRPGLDVILHPGDHAALVIQPCKEADTWTGQVFSPEQIIVTLFLND